MSRPRYTWITASTMLHPDDYAVLKAVAEAKKRSVYSIVQDAIRAYCERERVIRVGDPA